MKKNVKNIHHCKIIDLESSLRSESKINLVVSYRFEKKKTIVNLLLTVNFKLCVLLLNKTFYF